MGQSKTCIMIPFQNAFQDRPCHFLTSGFVCSFGVFSANQKSI